MKKANTVVVHQYTSDPQTHDEKVLGTLGSMVPAVQRRKERLRGGGNILEGYWYFGGGCGVILKKFKTVLLKT